MNSPKNSLSHSFKSTSRQKPPAWSNRFRKDVNDLIYQPKDLRDIQYIKKLLPENSYKQGNLKSSTSRSPMKKAMEKYNVVPFRSNDSSHKNMRRSFSTTVPSQLYKTQSKEYLKLNAEEQSPSFSQLKKQIYKNHQNDQLLRTSDSFIKRSYSMSNLSSRLQSSNINQYGLSPFEFGSTTIQGKIDSRSGHHLNLQKSKTQKINNLKTIYYNKHEDVPIEEFQKRRAIEALRKYRNFKSYSPHKLYKDAEAGEGGLLDKFYTVQDKHFDLIKKKCSLDIDFAKNSPRPGIPKKYGTHLDYPGSYIEIAKSDSKRPLYKVQQLERKLVITKQTIYDKRGCYR